MALNVDPTVYTAAAVTAILDAMEADLDEFDRDVAEPNIEHIVIGLEDMIRTMLSDTEVTFSSGDFGGTDSAGDTPDNITASGGVVS